MKKFVYAILILLFSITPTFYEEYIKMYPKDYKIIKQYNDNLMIEMEILNEEIFTQLNSGKNISLTFLLNNKLYIAKGNEIIKSSVPDNCDYFSPIDSNGNIIFLDKILQLYKISHN